LPGVDSVLASLSAQTLREWVEQLARPRHYVTEPEENERAALWIASLLQRWDYQVELQGRWRNVVARPRPAPDALLLVGAHYDSVGGCPGADDNASAVAALLGCAQACAGLSRPPPVGFVAFNREEDGFQGSRDFVQHLVADGNLRVSQAHILEMVGFASDQPATQRIPPGLPVRIPDTGNFLGLLANRTSYPMLEQALTQASTYLPQLPVIALRVTLGLEKYFPVLLRSDHAPFWAEGIPAMMWTDTSEFRNPFYHQPGDQPQTLNYEFLLAVTRLLTACVLTGESA